jgi:hypothetical protein
VESADNWLDSFTNPCSSALHCNVLYCTVLNCAELYSTVLYCSLLYSTLLYCTVLYALQAITAITNSDLCRLSFSSSIPQSLPLSPLSCASLESNRPLYSLQPSFMHISLILQSYCCGAPSRSYYCNILK